MGACGGARRCRAGGVLGLSAGGQHANKRWRWGWGGARRRARPPVRRKTATLQCMRVSSARRVGAAPPKSLRRTRREKPAGPPIPFAQPFALPKRRAATDFREQSQALLFPLHPPFHTVLMFHSELQLRAQPACGQLLPTTARHAGPPRPHLPQGRIQGDERASAAQLASPPAANRLACGEPSRDSLSLAHPGVDTLQRARSTGPLPRTRQAPALTLRRGAQGRRDARNAAGGGGASPPGQKQAQHSREGRVAGL